jgi:outer membrane protein assembly factor BamB
VRARLPIAGALLALLLGACGSAATGSRPAASTAAPVAGHAGAGGSGSLPSGDWPQFGYTAQRTSDGPAATGITAGDLGSLTRRIVRLPGTADSAAIELHAVKVKGHRRDVVFLTTSYGITLAIDAGTGRRLWQFRPSDEGTLAGTPQITNATPTADPDRRFIYAASPDGLVRKLSVATGRQVRSGRWPARVTLLPSREKLASPPTVDGSALIVATDGYDGDTPPYQGHVVRIDRASGRIEAVFNTLCSNVTRLMLPHRCPYSDSAIWGRAGAVELPGGDVLVTTGNGAPTSDVTFNGRTNWSDSVLELSPSLRLRHNWTPANQLELTHDDLDLGSTSPALLPGGLAVQGGKTGQLNLLDLSRLDGTTGPAGPRAGGQLQTIPAPGPTDVFSAPAVSTIGGRTLLFVADAAGTAAYALHARRLALAWQDGAPGTSPVVAGGLLYVYDEQHGTLDVRDPSSGRELAALPVGTGHWNSPIVVGGRIILPVGNANDHSTRGTLYIFHLPGR